MRSKDGGSTWNLMISGTQIDLSVVQCPGLQVSSGAVVLIAGNAGLILRSDDGGDRWAPVSTSGSRNFSSLVWGVGSAKAVLLARHDPNYYLTSDGGITFSVWPAPYNSSTSTLQAAAAPYGSTKYGAILGTAGAQLQVWVTPQAINTGVLSSSVGVTDVFQWAPEAKPIPLAGLSGLAVPGLGGGCAACQALLAAGSSYDPTQNVGCSLKASSCASGSSSARCCGPLQLQVFTLPPP